MARHGFVAATLIGALSLGGAALAQDPRGAGPGYGMGPGYPGGMMQGYGYGYGGGQGYGMGPGYGPGYGAGPGYGMGPGMMQGWGGGYPGGGMGPGGLVDADGDGIVGADEAATMSAAHFDVFDADASGALSSAEYAGAAPLGGWNMGPRPGMAERRAARFAEWDADKNGEVTRAEFIAAEEAAFKAADGNGDGTVTVWEFRAAQRPF